MAICNEKGQIISKSEMLTGTTKNGETWKKQSIVLEVIDGNFLYHIAIDAMNEKVDQLASFQEGDKVDVGYVVRSREYNGRWYTDVKLVGIRHEGDRPAPRQAAPAPTPAPVQTAVPAAPQGNNPEDDLPF